MSVAGTFYDTQAQICANNAAETSLPMLRDKFERAGAAWRALATRETEIESARNRRLAEAEAASLLARQASSQTEDAFEIGPELAEPLHDEVA